MGRNTHLHPTDAQLRGDLVANLSLATSESWSGASCVFRPIVTTHFVLS
jgi:hypothetical protein